MKRQALQDSLKAFLGQNEYDLWLTITFWKQTNLSTAKRKFKHFFKYLNTKQKSYFNNFIKCWVFFEKEDFRTGVHLHALISGISIGDAETLKIKCDQYFGNTVIKAVHDNVLDYLTAKYDTDKLEDFDLFKINSRLRSRSTRPSGYNDLLS